MKNPMFLPAVSRALGVFAVCCSIAHADGRDVPPPPPGDFTPAVTNWADTRDEDFTSRGFIATREDPIIRNADGSVAFDLGASSYLDGESLPYVHPSLLRQARLLRRNGLFEVVDGVYQVRGFDVTNVTFVRGDSGWIVIDPALAPATARAAYELVSQQLGERPIKAVIYTHSHLDHFGGAAGVISPEQVANGAVSVIAPEGFTDATLREFLVNGNATRRRTTFAGIPLPQNQFGTVGVGISNGAARGMPSFIPPTVSVTPDHQEMTVDGVDLVFQLTPGTEAPAEMNIYLPQFRVLDMAENANVTMHNVLSPRGVEVRDAKGWADYLSESIRRFGDRSDAVIVSHGWPRFGQPEVVDYLSNHRDAYKYLHDQTVRMMNNGLLPAEIANRLRLPDSLAKQWYNHGYYGSLSFNSRAVYQRYLGWYDGNPVHLAPFEPAEDSARYVRAMGGRDNVIAQAHKALDDDDLQWAAELLNHVVMSNAGDTQVRELLAGCYEKMGYRQENGMWRNMYLTGARELRDGVPQKQLHSLGSPGILRAIPTATLFEMLAVQLDPAAAGGETATLRFDVTDTNQSYLVTVRHDVLTYIDNPAPDQRGDAAVRLTKMQLASALFARKMPEGLVAEGDSQRLQAFLGWFERPDSNFPVLWRGQ